MELVKLALASPLPSKVSTNIWRKLLYCILTRWLGTSVHVFGTSNLEYNTGGQPINPTWTCAVDKIQIPSGEPTRGVQNNWHLCDQPDMADGDHVLTVNVTTAGRTFWLDHIQYTPSNDVPLDAAVVKVDNLDPSIVFDTAWRAHSATNMTQTPGSKMTFNFTGSFWQICSFSQ